MKKLLLAVATVAAVLLGSGLSAPAQTSSYLVTLRQVGSNVVATGSGTINTSALSPSGRLNFSGSQISPQIASIATGPTLTATLDDYTGFRGPTNFGTGADVLASSGSGDLVDMDGLGSSLVGGILGVPDGYVSGTPLSGSSTYDNTTLKKLRVTPGTYEWTWGTGNSFTLDIVPPTATPAPAPKGCPPNSRGVIKSGKVTCVCITNGQGVCN
jgi:hypothetical protein